jgi:hypothetical protein
MSIRVHYHLALLVAFPLSLGGVSSAIGDDGARKAEEPSKENFHLFLLVGQSNMAGRGKVAEEDRKAHPRVLMLTKENRWVPAVAP